MEQVVKRYFFVVGKAREEDKEGNQPPTNGNEGNKAYNKEWGGAAPFNTTNTRPPTTLPQDDGRRIGGGKVLLVSLLFSGMTRALRITWFVLLF